MLGMNAHFAFGSVGIGVGNTDPAGPTHTVFDLLSPTLQAGASDCAGPGTSRTIRARPQCPSTRIGLCAGPAQRSFPLINPTWISGNGKRRPSIHVRLSSDVGGVPRTQAMPMQCQHGPRHPASVLSGR